MWSVTLSPTCCKKTHDEERLCIGWYLLQSPRSHSETAS